MDQYYDIFETPLGWMGALASDRGLRRTTLPHASPDLCAADLGPQADAASISPGRFVRLKSSVSLYLGGSAVSFGDEPIDVDDAPPFLRAAWDACRSIPYGETRSYKWLAAQAGRPRGPRAAGQSMARNRLPIIIPCHRVIGSDGSLKGFGSGAALVYLKRRLLDLEAGHALAKPGPDLAANP